MKKRVRQIIIYTIIFVLMLNISGIGMPVVQASEVTEEQEEVGGTIEVMGNIDNAIMQKYIEGFQQKYPGVTVKYNCFSDYEGEMQKRVASGEYGDVFLLPSFFSSTDVSRYVDNLGDYATLSEKYNFLENYKTKANKVYAIPSAAHITGIAYNKDVFYKAGITETPKTIEEFITALEAIQQRTDAIPFYTNYSDTWALQPWWYEFPYIDMTGNANYKENEFIDVVAPFKEGRPHYQVYKLLYDIVYNGLAGEKPLETNWEESKKMLNNGEIGCMAIGSWALTQFKNAGENGDSIAFMPFPNEIDGTQYMTISTDYCYALNKNSENKVAARAYIDYMLDESGYALDQECVSVVKTDPYPDAYGDMKNVVVLINKSVVGQNYNKKKKLITNLNIEDPENVKRIMEAAAGQRDETFDSIMNEWNTKWESGRTWNVETVEETEEESEAAAISIAENYEVNFSDTEKQYLEEKKTLKIGYLKKLAPFQFEGEEGFDGVAAELCNLIIEETGLQAEFIGYDNTYQMVTALENGQIEMIAGIERNDTYEEKVKFSKGYLEYMQVLVKNETVDVDMAQQGVFASVVGEITESDSSAKEIIKKETLAEAIKCVEQMEADYTVTNYYSANYYAGRLGSEHTILIPLTEQGTQYLAFARNVDTRLVSICNKCIYSISDANFQMMLMEYLDPEVEEVTFTRYIEANPFQAMAVMAAVLFMVLAAVLIVVKEREKSAQKHEIDTKKYETLASLMDEYIYEYDSETEILHFDKKVSEHFDFDLDVSVREYNKENEQLNFLIGQILNMEGKKDEEPVAFQLQSRDGETLWYELVSYAVNDKYGNPRNLIGKIVCVQKEMEEKQQMKRKAQTDPLTKIYNRDGFGEQFDILYQKEDNINPITFAVMDIDDFKHVNDTLGHRGGDEVLKLLAESMTAVCPSQSVVARYGGDEFMLMLWGIEEKEAASILNLLVSTMDRTIVWQGVSRKISISVGAICTDQRLPYKELFEKADEVLYEVKENGKNSCHLKRYEE